MKRINATLSLIIITKLLKLLDTRRPACPTLTTSGRAAGSGDPRRPIASSVKLTPLRENEAVDGLVLVTLIVRESQRERKLTSLLDRGLEEEGERGLL